MCSMGGAKEEESGFFCVFRSFLSPGVALVTAQGKNVGTKGGA